MTQNPNIDAILVLCSCGSEEEAQAIAQALVESRLAACVNVHAPVTSIYRWQGKVESAREWLLTVKSTADRFEEIESALLRMHSYQLPEIIAIPVTAGSAAYLAWLRDPN